jgi:hypothetical protein
MTRFRRKDNKVSPEVSIEERTESRRALEDSKNQVQQAKTKWAEISDLASSLKQIRRENHFEARIRAVLTRGE